MSGGYDAEDQAEDGARDAGERGERHEAGRGSRRGGAEQVRTFAALPPARGRGFALTWWGRAWLRALEDSALDGEQLRKGRRYARAGVVGAVSVRPGRLTAVVSDTDGTAHRTDVLVQRFARAEWNRFLDLAAAESGHIAALLDREMPPVLAEDAAAAGIELLPGMGDLDPRCDCGEWDHCAHTAALCYQLARLLDQDPMLLLLLRGLGEREVLDELQDRNAASGAAARRAGGGSGGSDTAGADGAGAAASCAEGCRSGGSCANGTCASGSGVDGVRASGAGASGPRADAAGVDAAEAFGAREMLPPLPPPPALPDGPGQPPLLDTETEPGDGLDPGAVEFLAEAAAVEAHRLLARALAPGHAEQPPPRSGAAPLPSPYRDRDRELGFDSGRDRELEFDSGRDREGEREGERPRDRYRDEERDQALHADLMRLAAVAADVRVLSRLAAASGRDRAGLGRAVRAWRYGGPAAVAVLEEAWQPTGEAAARARAALDTAWDEGTDGMDSDGMDGADSGGTDGMDSDGTDSGGNRGDGVGTEAYAGSGGTGASGGSGGSGGRPVLEADGNRWTLAGGAAQLRLGRDGRWWPYRRDGAHWEAAGPSETDPAAALSALDTGESEEPW
ncbi:SWF or SNF family helicase [Streptomyces sp. NBC_00239]|uniref:SWF or SNF family helicase n=1 Tax=Streptomyces sp. NBC_00239 TaxID=2903640 RepID=UPI002E2E2F8B|nr:SWF or SNF family helicase [Streptomyces sp. NBC_00239]